MEAMLMIMAGGAGALFFGVGLVLFLTSWGRCEKNLRSQGNKMTQPVAVGCCLLLLGVSAFVLHRGYSEYKGNQAAAEAKAQAKSLGFTVAEFKGRFNEAAKRVGMSQRVETPSITPADEAAQIETFRVLFGDNLGLIGSADKKSHAVTGFLVLLASKDRKKSESDFLSLLVLSGVLVEMCNPGVTDVQRAGILRELGMFGGQAKAELHEFDKGKDYVRAAQLDHTRYTFRVGTSGLAYFTAEPH